MGRELEFKFAASPADQAQIQEEFGDFEQIAMETTYFDTPARSLSAQRITLRRRLENGRVVCTIKTPLSGRGRGEWEMPDGDWRALFRLAGVEQPPEPLEEVCAARFTRLAKKLCLPDCTLELALDQGVLLGGGREQPLCEVELELKSGDEAAAEAYARDFAAQHGLKTEKKSKFRRALALAEGK